MYIVHDVIPAKWVFLSELNWTMFIDQLIFQTKKQKIKKHWLKQSSPKVKEYFIFSKVKTLIEFFLALTKHGVCTDKELEVDLVDEYQMSIDDENVGIVLQYKHCSHFFVELLMDYQHKQIPILIEVSLFWGYLLLLLITMITFILVAFFIIEHHNFFEIKWWWRNLKRIWKAEDIETKEQDYIDS